MKIKKDVKNIFNILEKFNRYPKTELIYKSEFELLLSVILSAKSKDKVVNKITYDLFKIANTPEKILELGEEKLKEKKNKENRFI